MDEVRRAYTHHRGNAKLRAVAFTLTFDQWWDIWQASGKFSQRGKHKGQYCMSRYGDRGAYEVGNVFVNLSSKNVGDGSRGLKRTAEQNAARSKWMRGNKHCVGRRWMHKNRSIACVARKDVAARIANGWLFGRKTGRIAA